MLKTSFGAAVAAAIGISFSPVLLDRAGGAQAAEIKVLSANVFTGVLDDLTSGFERSSGHKVIIIYDTAEH